MCMQKFIKIFHKLQDIGSVSLFHNLEVGKASSNGKWLLAIPLIRSCQYQRVCKKSSKYSISFKRYGQFHFFFFFFFFNFISTKTRLVTNDFWKSLGLDLVNIDVYAKFYQNIPYGSRVMDIVDITK